MDVNGFATGRLQVFQNGGFGGVCDQEFGDAGATVACRQLGFESGRVLPTASIPQSSNMSEVRILHIWPDLGAGLCM